MGHNIVFCQQQRIAADLHERKGKMKKLLIANLIMVASHSVFAADNKTSAAPDVFAKATQLYEAKNYPEAFQEMQRLANTGNAQAIYNVGYMTQIGQGTVKDEKKLCNIIRMPPTKDLVRPALSWHKPIIKGIWASPKMLKNTRNI